jgi:hypothetical protein
MNRLFWQAVKVAPVLFAASLFASNGASAQTITADQEGVNQTLEQINNYQQLEQNSQSQVTNVNQLRDVSPTDWAYEALRSLVDRYGCIAGFPNQTYRGSQALTRYEFAAGLNSCLNQIERLIASQGGVDQESLDTIARLTQEFEAELATLGGRVDELESRTAVLEDSQFSTTTKLNGEGIFAIADAFNGGQDLDALAEDALDVDDVSDEELQAFVGDFNGDGVIDDDDVDDAEDSTDVDAETTFSSRVRLNFDTSFFGNDRLRTRLEGGNVTDFGDDVTGTNSTRLGFDTNNDFDIEVTDLHYRYPVNERLTAWVGPFGLDLDDIMNVTNPSLESSGTGALSRFSRRNPVLFRGTEGAGAGVNVDIIPDRVGVNLGYLTDDAGSPDGEEGLFNGSFSAMAQVEFSPIEAVELTASYVRNYQTADSVNQSGSTVGNGLDGDLAQGFATEPFGETDTTANKIGAGVSVNVGERFVIAGFGGYADVEGLVDGDDNNPSGEIWTWGANVSVLDLVKEGSQLSIAGGMLPKFVSDIGPEEFAAGVQEDPDTSYLVEALYKFPLNDNILITPGAYAVFNPNHVDGNDTVYVGVVRTTFKF